jgi:hypothetical protein
MFGSTMISWRSMLSDVKREEERSNFELMTHSPCDQDVFERRRNRLSKAKWQAFRLVPKTAMRIA